MEQIEFAVSGEGDLTRAEQVIEAACEELGLIAARKDTLKAFPGSVHWHYRNGRQKGTLELTLFRPDRRIWANVHLNRRGEWIPEALRRLRARVERELKAQKRKAQ